MQERRRGSSARSDSPPGGNVRVPKEFWDELTEKDLETVRDCSLARIHSPQGLILTFLGQEILIDMQSRCLKGLRPPGLEKIEEPLLELICLVYLLNAGPEGPRGDLISVRDLKNAHFFQGPHRLDLDPLLRKYGRDADGFRRSAESLGGRSLSMADVAYRIPALPKIPLYYLLWEGDEEFEPRMSVLFDRSVEMHLSADALWGLVNLVSRALLEEKAGHDFNGKKVLLNSRLFCAGFCLLSTFPGVSARSFLL